MEYKIIRLIDQPEMKEQMAQWFHEKWAIPLDTYLESMNVALPLSYRGLLFFCLFFSVCERDIALPLSYRGLFCSYSNVNNM